MSTIELLTFLSYLAVLNIILFLFFIREEFFELVKKLTKKNKSKK